MRGVGVIMEVRGMLWVAMLHGERCSMGLVRFQLSLVD